MAYLARRLIHAVIVIFLVTLLVFFVIRLKGDPVMHFIPPTATPRQIAELRKIYGFDRPIYVQYLDFLGDILHADFGTSFRYRTPALPLVVERLPTTAYLTLWALVVALVIALPLGTISALRPNSPADFVATTLSVLGRAMPDYWLGIMLMLLFAVTLRWLPVSGVGTARHMVLPAVTLGVGLATTLTRLIRSGLLEVLGQDYIVTARSKGLVERTVIYKHALRNALLPVVTVLGVHIAWLLGGATVIEQVFAVPGVGQLTIRAVMQSDMAVIQAAVFVFALIVMAASFIVDVLYTFIDPRIRYQ